MGKNFFYAAVIRLPTEKAHGAQIMHTASALARAGAKVVLAVPGRQSEIAADPFDYYGVERNFEIMILPVGDHVARGRIGFLFSAFSFAKRVAKHARAGDIIYSRDKAVLLWLRFFGARGTLVWEVHGQEPVWAVRMLKKCKMIAISNGVKEHLVAQGVPAKCVLVAHDGVDLTPFSFVEKPESARQRLGLPGNKKIVMYVGRLDGWKGAETLLEASAWLPHDAQVAVIGGEPQQVVALQKKYPGVLFLGFRPYKELAHNLAAADVLVLPNTARDATSARYTSPLKLFGYMAAGKPIVMSDLPSLREVVSKEDVFFATPDDPEALAEAIGEALHAPDSLRRAKSAQDKVKEYTWDKRAERIFSFVK